MLYPAVAVAIVRQADLVAIDVTKAFRAIEFS
jgi:hypothetical protein